jgi:hypothetical protein
MDSGQRSLLAIQLPRETSDDDLASLKITWTRDDRAASGSETRPISGLAAAPAANPFSFSYDCYYRVPDCTPGYGYAYTVTVVDAAGQESAAVGTSGTANSFFINYRGNGSTGGTAPAAVGYRFAAVTAVAAPGSLVRENYAFSSWNTAADGSGTAYLPGAAIIVPAGDLTLYAQWITNGTGISFDRPGQRPGRQQRQPGPGGRRHRLALVRRRRPGGLRQPGLRLGHDGQGNRALPDQLHRRLPRHRLLGLVPGHRHPVGRRRPWNRDARDRPPPCWPSARPSLPSAPARSSEPPRPRRAAGWRSGCPCLPGEAPRAPSCRPSAQKSIP